MPLQSLGIVLRHAIAHHIEYGEIVLSDGISEFSGAAIPSGGLLGILRHSASSFVEFSEGCLRSCVSLLGRQAIPFCRFVIALGNALTAGVAGAELFLC